MKRSSIGPPMIAVLLSLVFVEAILQLAALVNPHVALLLSPGIPTELPDPVLGKRPNPAIPDHDSRGYRNPEALDRADVVVMGDSQTYGAEVSRANAWPTLLGESLGVPIYSIAFSGWGPVQYYLVADQAFALNPRVLIVAIYAGNDLADAYSVVMRTDVPALTRGAPHDRASFEAFEEREGPVGRYWTETRDLRRGAFKTWTDPVVKPLEAHFKIYGLIRGLARVRSAEEANMKTDSVRDDFEKYAGKISHLPPDYYFPFRTGQIATVFTPLARKAVEDRRDPRIEEGLRVSLAALEGLNDRCSGPCTMLVVTIPTKEYAFSEAVAKSGVEAPAAYHELVVAEQALWQTIREQLEHRGIPVLDAREALVRAIASGANPYLSDWDGHPNMLGNRVIADLVAAHPLLETLKR